jgi:hypothetical protein
VVGARSNWAWQIEREVGRNMDNKMNGTDRFQVLKRKTKLVSNQDINTYLKEHVIHEVDFLKHQKNILVEKSAAEYDVELKVATFSPHADDIELGCGATLARLIEQNNAKLYYYVFITRRRNLEGKEIEGDGDLRLQNCKSAFKFLISGESELTETEKQNDEFIVEKNGKWGKFNFLRNCSDKELYLNKEQIFKEVRKLQITELSDVDIVFVPSFNDVHHDHQLLAEIGYQVFRKQENILYYRTPDSKIFPHQRFNPNIFIESSIPIKPGGNYRSLLSECQNPGRLITYVDVKLKLLSYFQTEINSLWFDKELFLIEMKSNAYDAYMTTTLDKEKYAEAFEGIIRI